METKHPLPCLALGKSSIKIKNENKNFHRAIQLNCKVCDGFKHVKFCCFGDLGFYLFCLANRKDTSIYILRISS